MAILTYCAKEPVIITAACFDAPVTTIEMSVNTRTRHVFGLGYEGGHRSRPVHFDVSLDDVASPHRQQIEQGLEEVR